MSRRATLTVPSSHVPEVEAGTEPPYVSEALHGPYGAYSPESCMGVEVQTQTR